MEAAICEKKAMCLLIGKTGGINVFLFRKTVKRGEMGFFSVLVAIFDAIYGALSFFAENWYNTLQAGCVVCTLLQSDEQVIVYDNNEAY